MTGVRHALVVDDVLINRKLAVAFFAKLGWTSTEVDGGQAAQEWLLNNPAVDLVLLDISMPDLGGEELCQRLRALPAFEKKPIVAYTAHALECDIKRFLAGGFDKVLLKPSTMQSLKEILDVLFPEA